jgi:hypothetical protein
MGRVRVVLEGGREDWVGGRMRINKAFHVLQANKNQIMCPSTQNKHTIQVPEGLRAAHAGLRLRGLQRRERAGEGGAPHQRVGTTPGSGAGEGAQGCVGGVRLRVCVLGKGEGVGYCLSLVVVVSVGQLASPFESKTRPCERHTHTHIHTHTHTCTHTHTYIHIYTHM